MLNGGYFEGRDRLRGQNACGGLKVTMRKSIHNLETVALAVALSFIGVAATNARPVQAVAQDNDTTRADIANFDQFLDTHPEIAARIQKTPSLVNDSSYVSKHSALNAYLNDHPQIREELQENPTLFMSQEQRLEQNESREPRKLEGNVARFDGEFLDYHPEIAQQLAKHPSLVNNADYLRNHPELRQYLQGHPALAQEITTHPDAFMAAEQRYDASGRDVTRSEILSWNGFLKSNPDVAQELDKNPALANNSDYIKNHPAFQEFLSGHPGIRGELIKNPQDFMSDATHYGAQPAHFNYRYPGVVTAFDSFLDSHPAIAQELYRNPSLAQNPQYLASHPELQEYLESHANVSQALTANLRGFMDTERRYDAQTSAWPRPLPRTVAEFDQFLDGHPAIARELDRNPSLVSNKDYLTNHPELQEYLQSHPAIDRELAARPDAIMSAAQRYDRSGYQARLRGTGSAGVKSGDNDTTSTELKSFGGFLGDHPELAEQLRAHPSVINTEAFVRDHPELQSYLNSNTAVAEELKENPEAFMNQLRQGYPPSSSSSTSGKTSTSQQTPPKLTRNPPH